MSESEEIDKGYELLKAQSREAEGKNLEKSKSTAWANYDNCGDCAGTGKSIKAALAGKTLPCTRCGGTGMVRM